VRFPWLQFIHTFALANVSRDTGIQAEHIMKTGGLVSDSMILRLIRSALTNRGWLIEAGGMRPMTLNSVVGSYTTSGLQDTMIGEEHITKNIPRDHEWDREYEFTDHPDASFILDGFPRNEHQAEQLDELVPMNWVVNMKTPSEIIMDRICNRWIHTPSGRTYNTTFNAPRQAGKDDVTGEALSQREDDKPEVWQARLKQFEEASLPLLEHYEKLGVLWTVNGNSSDEISPKLFAEFEKRFAKA
jgi:adenylate kinase